MARPVCPVTEMQDAERRAEAECGVSQWTLVAAISGGQWDATI